MVVKNMLIVVGCSLLLSPGGCSFGTRMSKLNLGMSRPEVVSNLGRPDGAQLFSDPKLELIEYFNRTMELFGPKQRADYYVLFTDGQVTNYGVSNVRQIPLQESVLFVAPLESQSAQAMPAPPLMHHHGD